MRRIHEHLENIHYHEVVPPARISNQLPKTVQKVHPERRSAGIIAPPIAAQWVSQLYIHNIKDRLADTNPSRKQATMLYATNFHLFLSPHSAKRAISAGSYSSSAGIGHFFAKTRATNELGLVMERWRPRNGRVVAICMTATLEMAPPI